MSCVCASHVRQLTREDGYCLRYRCDIQNHTSTFCVRRKGYWHGVFHSQQGFTLVEIIATVSLLGILLAMATGGLTYYFSVKSLETSGREITTEIRAAQAMAVATGNTYRLAFDTANETYTLQRRSGAEYPNVKGPLSLEGGTQFATAPTKMDFYARSSCEGGQVVLKNNYGKPITITVDSETVHINES